MGSDCRDCLQQRSAQQFGHPTHHQALLITSACGCVVHGCVLAAPYKCVVHGCVLAAPYSTPLLSQRTRVRVNQKRVTGKDWR
jgi:hypothetical protein